MQRARPPLARSDCSNESKLDCSLRGGGPDCITVGKDKAAPYKSVSHKNSLPNSVLTLFHQLSYELSVCVPVHAEDVQVLADFNLFVVWRVSRFLFMSRFMAINLPLPRGTVTSVIDSDHSECMLLHTQL